MAASKKKCFRCGLLKGRKCFGKDRSRSDGLNARCSPCEGAYKKGRAPQRRVWSAANRERLTEKHKEWCMKNPQRANEINKKSNSKNAEEIRRRDRESYAKDPEKYIQAARKWRLDNYEKYVLNRLKRRAVEFGVPFDLTSEDIKIPEFCPVLGIRLVKDEKGQRQDRPSVDRLVPSKGYVRGNIVVISMKANNIKNNATCEEVEKVLNYMRRFKCP